MPDSMDNPPQPRSQALAPESRRVRWLAGVLGILLLLAAAAPYAVRYLYNPCEVQSVEAASAFLESQLKTYDGVYQVAVTAFRTSPDHPVNTLKQIYMDSQQVDVPACLQTAKSELIDYMGSVIYAFQAYRSGEADAAVRGLLNESNEHYQNFQAELDAVQECAPFCLR